jgi:hypothetical protein
MAEMTKLTDDKRREYADKSRKLKQDNPKLTYDEIAKELGLSASHLCKLRRRFPPKISQDEDETSKEILIDAFKEEFGMEEDFYSEDKVVEEEEAFEIVKGYIVDKKGPSPHSVPFEISIPAGLDKRTRGIVIHSIAFECLEIVEI